MVENEEEGDPSQETITFLYKFSMVNFLLLLSVETGLHGGE